MHANCKWTVCNALSRVVVFLTAGACLLLPARAEIPAGPEVPTRQDFTDLEVQVLTRLILEPYQVKRAEDASTTAENDPAELFLQLWITALAEDFDGADFESMAAPAKQAIDAGSDDPMFAYCYGRLLRYQRNYDESAKHLKHALDNLEPGGYDACFGAGAASTLAEVLQELKRPDEAKELDDRVIECIIKTVADGPFHPDEQRMLHQHVSWAFEKFPIEKLPAIIDKIDTHLYPWLWHMASARLEIRQAWKARGGGWANEVTEEGWKGFEKHIVAAREHLNEAWNLNPEWPEAATCMITVAMSGHAPPEETPRFWFDRAAAAEVDHGPAYNALMWSLLPRWGGSHEELYALGRECLETGRFDTHVPYYYLEAFEHIVKDLGSSLDYYKIPGIYEDLQTLADGYIAEPTMKRNHAWYRSFKMATAVRCARWQDARQFMDAIDGEPEESAFTRVGLKSAETLGEIYARSGELAEQTAEAEELAAAGKYAEAKAKYEDLAGKSGDRQEVTTFFRGRLQGVEFDGDFADGKWITLPLDPQLTGWRKLGGKWSVDDEGRLIAEPRTNGLRLVYERKLGTRFELRGKVAFIKRPYTQSNVGVYFGQESGVMPNSFRMFFDEDYAAVLKHHDPLERKEVNVKDENTFRIERWDNLITAYVNDERVANAVEIESYGPAESEVIALGGNYWYKGPVLRFENLEIRKLDERPAGDIEEAEAPQTTEEKVEPAVEEKPNP